jgi:hypothetical protein
VTEAAAAASYVPREILERLVDDLTVEDVRLARAEYPEGDPMRGFASVYFAALRTGAAKAEDGPSGFLARVRLRDLTPILERAAESLPNAPSGSASSPGSAGSGE